MPANDGGLTSLLPAHSTMSAHVRAGVQSLQSVSTQSSSHGSAFRSISATANREALRSASGPKKRKVDDPEFSRNTSAAFSVRLPVEDAESAPRNDALQVIERIGEGVQKFVVDESDPHYMKVEPNTRIRLRKRFISHAHLQGHFEGRSFVTISKLYSGARPQRSDDGDFTLPVDGDWLTMGVLTAKAKRIVRQAVTMDYKDNEIDEHLFQQRWQAYKQRKGGASETLDDEDNPYRDVKEIQPALECISATLTDMGQPLSRNETAGDSQIELTLFQSSAERKASDQQKQAFTVIDLLPLGSVICLLNPLLKKQAIRTAGSTSKDKFLNDRSDPQAWRTKSNHSTQDNCVQMRLQARKGEAILAVGSAADFKTCGAMCRSGQPCDNFVDARSRLSACSFHMYSAASRHRSGRQEFANGTSSLLPTAEAPMFGSKSRTYVSQSSQQDRRATNPASSTFRVEQRYGREKELKRLREQKMKAEDAVRDHLQSKGSSITVSSQVKSKACAPLSVIKEAKGGGNGAKAVDDALRALLKSRGVKDLDTALGKRLDTGNDHKKNRGLKLDATSSNAEIQSSKLLTRHSASSEALPRPILREKKAARARSAVRPPPGESFHACESSDEELDQLVAGGAFDTEPQHYDEPDEGSDLEIVH